jgi:hypothetical protein
MNGGECSGPAAGVRPGAVLPAGVLGDVIAPPPRSPRRGPAPHPGQASANMCSRCRLSFDRDHRAKPPWGQTRRILSPRPPDRDPFRARDRVSDLVTPSSCTAGTRR